MAALIVCLVISTALNVAFYFSLKVSVQNTDDALDLARRAIDGKAK